MRYERNRIYTTAEELEIVKNTPILIAGCGVGSNIAECALRFGFEKLTLIDGDVVERTNLNRQNYTEKDLGKYKAQALAERLLAVHPQADIRYQTQYITPENVDELVHNHRIAVNAMDFTTDIPLVFDRTCQEKGIYVLHPYNLGWEALLTIITPNSLRLEHLTTDEGFNELKMIEYVTGYLRFWKMPEKWLEEVLTQYKEEQQHLPPPQLSVASWLIGGICAKAMYYICTGKAIKQFPEFYLTKTLQ